MFAGFSIAFIIFVLGLGPAKTTACLSPQVCPWLTDLGIVLMGIAVGLFVAASQFFLQAKACDMRTLPKDYMVFLSKELDKDEVTFEAAAVENDRKIHYYETRGRHFYNIAVILMSVGFGVVVMSYNPIVGAVVLVASLLPELYGIAVIP